METFLHILAIGLLLLTSVAGWVLTLFGMPGNWVTVAVAAAYAWLGPQTGATRIEWSTVGVLLCLAMVGEVAETAAGMAGARRVGGSRRAAVFSLGGSFLGAFAGAAVGVPIPLLGSAVGAVLGAAVGAFAGAAFAEHSLGEHPHQSFRVGRAAFWGRLLGTGAKTVLASVITAVVFGALIV